MLRCRHVCARGCADVPFSACTLNFLHRMRFEEILGDFKYCPLCSLISYKLDMHSCQLKVPVFTLVWSEELEKKRCSMESLWWIFCRWCGCLSFHLSPAHFGLLQTSARSSRSSLSLNTYQSSFWTFRTRGALGWSCERSGGLGGPLLVPLPDIKYQSAQHL